jgi:phosphohistidine phosphatase
MDAPSPVRRQLWILRHAEAVPGSPPGGRDRDRPLTGKGRGDAAALGARLAAGRPVLGTPGLVLPTTALCSAARRTLQTAEAVLGPLGGSVRPEPYRSLYSAEPETVLAYVREVDGDPVSVLVVGHNPTVSHLAFDLQADGSPGRVRLGSQGLAPCSLAVVELDVPTWEDTADGCGTLLALFRPPY